MTRAVEARETDGKGALYRTLWRWHFYAGLICIPFVIWLAVTGSVYLFRPQIEAWFDRDVAVLERTGSPATQQQVVDAALGARWWRGILDPRFGATPLCCSKPAASTAARQ